MKIIKLLTWIFLVGVLVSGCESDDNDKEKEEPTVNNYFELDDSKFSINDNRVLFMGELQNIDSDGTSFSYNIRFIDNKGLNFGSEGNIIGKGGNGLSIEFNAASNKIEGTYAISEQDVTNSASIFLGLNYNADEDEGEGYDFDKEGTLTISKDGTNYIVKVESITEKGRKLTVYYKGKLKEATVKQ